MPKFVSAHFIDDLAVSVDEHCALHVGACRNNRIMNVHRFFEKSRGLTKNR
jgi:hypothetical protein